MSDEPVSEQAPTADPPPPAPAEAESTETEPTETKFPEAEFPEPAPAGVAPGLPGPPGPGGYTRLAPGQVVWPGVPAPPRPGWLATRWPGPANANDLAVLVAVAAGALGFAVFLPLGHTGIGWFLAGLLPAVGVAVVARRSGAVVPLAERVIRAAWGLSALALLSVLAFRNAWWLVTFCVLGALGCATLAIVGGRTIRSILFSLLAAPFAAFRALPWVSRHADSVRRDGSAKGLGKRIGWSLLTTVVVLLVFGGLFASADAAFSELLGRYTPHIDAPAVILWLFLFGVGGLMTTAAVYLVAAPPDLSGMDTPGRQRWGPAEWLLPIGALVLLFAGFVVVQVTVLFGGRRHVLETAGLTYAEYARSGFVQLILVTMLTLLILSAMGRWASRETSRHRTLLRVMLGLLCVLSVVVVASALQRMYAYQEAYSFTGERIFVMAFELLLGTIFVLVMVAGIRWRGAWLPRVVVGLTVVMLLSLAVLNPEQYAAERNVARYRDTGQIDLWYLRALSADATPTLATLPDEARRCTLMRISQELADTDVWYTWNLGRQRAREELARLGPAAVGDCSAAGDYDFPKTRTS